MKKVACRNTECKHYRKGMHCAGGDTCSGYKTVQPQRVVCAQCAYCKKVTAHKGKQYHWECQYKGVRRTILFPGTRICDVKIEDFT